MSESFKYQVNVHVADNPVTPDNPDDKIFTVMSKGLADRERIIQEMMAVNPGLERETVALVHDLRNRVCSELLLQGMRVNDGFCNASLTCRGQAKGLEWDPDVNSLHINLRPTQELRDLLKARTQVNVVGERPRTAYIAVGMDIVTKAEGNVTQPGSIYAVQGRKIKVEGTHPAVGIWFVAEDGAETKVTHVAVNNPKELTFVVPASLAAGTYTLRIVTQYAGSGGRVLKDPRTLESIVYLEEAAR